MSDNKCSICAGPAKEGYLGVGFFCSEKCRKALVERHTKYEDELLSEGIDVMPDEFDIPTFDRYIRKVALHKLKDLPKKMMRDWKKKSPEMLVPSHLAMTIKGKVIQKIPLFYVSAIKSEVQEGVTLFQFKAKVPKAVVVKALIDAKVFKGR